MLFAALIITIRSVAVPETTRLQAMTAMTAFMEVKVLIFLMAVRVMTCWMAAVKSVTLIFSVPDMAKIPLVITP